MSDTLPSDPLIPGHDTSHPTANTSQLSIMETQGQDEPENPNPHDTEDPMNLNDTDNHNIPVLGSSLRKHSLLLASFPWFSSVIMTPKKFSEELRTEHYGYEFARSIDAYETFLQEQSLHVSPLKALMREVDTDVMAGMTPNAISLRESSLLKKRERASDFCSLLTAYRLLDIISLLEATESSVRPPVQLRSKVDIPKNTKFVHYFKDWTSTLQKFRRNYSARQKTTLSVNPISDPRIKQLHALFQLHTGMVADKGLFNMQLAAAHISFMLQCTSKDNIIPDLPDSLQAFKDIALLNPSTSNAETDLHFISCLEKISGDQMIDQLRFPLQIALLISPIFLLQDVQIHLSQFQRYRLALYSKALGNDRPDIIANVERIIWQQLFEVAKGLKTIEEAAQFIIENIPSFDTIDDTIRNWFLLDPPSDKKETIVHLSSILIENGTIPESWPLASTLGYNDSGKSGSIIASGSSQRSLDDITGAGSNKPNRNIDDQDISGRQLRERSSKFSGPSSSYPTVRNNKRRKNKGKSHSTSMPIGLGHKTISKPPQPLPFIIGKTYLKIEDINLEELMAPKSKLIDCPLPLLQRPTSTATAKILTTNVHGDILEHTITVHSDKLTSAVVSFFDRIENLLDINGRIPYIQNSQTSDIMVVNSETAQNMGSRSFQKELRGHHIIVTNVHLSQIPCDRHGLLSLNGSKEIVDMEDQTTVDDPMLIKRTVKEFIENLSSQSKNILRTFRMKSYSGIESSSFSSDHAAWRETLSEPYCDQDDVASQSSLRWTEASTANAIRFWRLAPAGFGIYLDIRSGQQWVIIATSDRKKCDRDVDHFTRWDRYLQDFDPMKPKFNVDTPLEAIRLEPGNRLILRPNTPYVTITLEDSIITGGFYLSTHTFWNSLHGRIHTFILPSLLTEGEEPSFSIFTRRIVHYIHNSFVLNDPDEGNHLPDLCTMDGVRDLFSLFAATMLLNVFDQRTYQIPSTSANQPHDILEKIQDLYDLNAIPVVERHHFCYTRGLVLDLVFWVFDHYSFSDCHNLEKEIDGYRTMLIPFLVHLCRQIMHYKRVAADCGHITLSTKDKVKSQIRSVLLFREEMEEEFNKQVSAQHEAGYFSDGIDSIDNPTDIYDMDFDLTSFTVSKRQFPASNSIRSANFLLEGQTLADKRFFSGLSCQFHLHKDASQHSDESQSEESFSDRPPAKIQKRHHNFD